MIGTTGESFGQHDAGAKRPVVTATLLLIVGLAVGCASSDSDAQGCVPGQSVACTGRDSCSGYQVCNDDGQGYGPCECVSSSGSGGAALAAAGGTEAAGDGGPGSGTGGAAAGTGGRQAGSGGLAATGGALTAGPTGGALVDCDPQDMSSWAPPAYVPARAPAQDCTEAMIRQYATECLNGDCSAFEAGGEHAACGACLAPTAVGASEYGPLVLSGTVRETNMAGCIELLGEAACAEHQQAKSTCEREACAPGCPVTDAQSLTLYQQCKEGARYGVCDAYRQAAVCIADPAHIEACGGDTFEEGLVAVGIVFCGR